jgi:hypothetical protein
MMQRHQYFEVNNANNAIHHHTARSTLRQHGVADKRADA